MDKQKRGKSAPAEAAPLKPKSGLNGPPGRQWVAHSGLDPAHHQSGTSVQKRSRISRAGNRYLRRALYMPALVAVRHDPHLRAFYQTLLARHKAKLQALVAVARKMLHAIFGMFRGQCDYDGSRLLPILKLQALAETACKRGSPAPLQRKKLLPFERESSPKTGDKVGQPHLLSEVKEWASPPMW